MKILSGLEYILRKAQVRIYVFRSGRHSCCTFVVMCSGLGGICSITCVSVHTTGGTHSAYPGLEKDGTKVQ